MVEPIRNSDHRFASEPKWFSAHVNLWSEETEVIGGVVVRLLVIRCARSLSLQDTLTVNF